MARAEAAWAQRQAEAADAEAGEAPEEDSAEAYLPTEPGPLEGRAESKEPSTGPTSTSSAPVSAVDRLAHINVFLTRARLNHVHQGHRALTRDPTKSKFLPAHSTRAGLKALLARGLEAEARAGRLGRDIELDTGCCVTYCNFGEEIGRHNPGNNHLTPTSWVKVVTVPYYNPETGAQER